MANFALTASSIFQFVFYGGAYVNVELSSGLTEVSGIAQDESNAIVGRQYYKTLIEYASGLGIQVAEANICYIKDITSDPTIVPNAISFTTAALPYALEFKALGYYQVDTNVDGIGYVWKAGTIDGVFVSRAGAGASSDTIIDLNKNGTTLYTTSGNRPTIAFNDGDKVISATLPDITSVALGDRITMDIDQIETAAPFDLRCWVRIVPSI